MNIDAKMAIERADKHVNLLLIKKIIHYFSLYKHLNSLCLAIYDQPKSTFGFYIDSSRDRSIGPRLFNDYDSKCTSTNVQLPL